MKNEKAVAETTAQTRTDKQLTNQQINSKGESISMNTIPQNKLQFQYHCSFCACELPDDGLRFSGVEACPACDDLAHFWVDSLRDCEA
ncbi:MAG: hypothetical protein ACR2LT_03965, partial [Pyrinomonadaceae bacterium]